MRRAHLVLFASVACWVFIMPALAAGDDARAKENVLHSFGSGADGAKPFANLTAMKGVLYGTTLDGGAHGDGTVFAIDPKSGAETVLYSFCSQQNCTDGEQPYGNLTVVKGELYGTTQQGGATNNGTIYAFNPGTGTVTVVYSFCSQQNCADGSEPFAGLTSVKDRLYGTAFDGGAHGDGVVFAFDPKTAAEEVLYSFCSQQDCADGNEPVTNLLELNGALYGTSLTGGAHNYGTVFSVNPKTGAETVLYSFCSQDGCTDGGPSEAALIAVNGTLYGTTYGGGAVDRGTVFTLDPSTGVETVLYSFCSKQNCTDGAEPFAGLLAAKDALYGMTGDGGTQGFGTVFSLDPVTGREKVLYSFCSEQDCADGEGSAANLINEKGTLYGTTFLGGANGLGTVFALKP